MTNICFLDTETLGLHPDAPVWEFAAILRPDSDPARTEFTEHFTIQHDPTGWLDDFPEEFARDYHSRYDETRAYCEDAAAHAIHTITKDAVIVGAVPSFDTERLAKLLRRNGLEPQWHYHLVDVENVIVGYLSAARQVAVATGRTNAASDALMPPWKSDSLSHAVGVDPEQFARHTAMGDVQWVRAQWDAVMETAAPRPSTQQGMTDMQEGHQMTASPRWATKEEAAQHIGVHPRTITRWADEGRIRRHHFGPRLIRFDLNEIDAMSSPTDTTEATA